MIDQDDAQDDDTLKVEGENKSSARVLSAIKKAERSLNDYQDLCDRIDDIYSRSECYSESDWKDPDYDLFWASMEIMKPAIYARPPKPVVSPQFKDRRPLQNTTAELLERSVTSAFDRTTLDEGMICARDDLIFYNRGQLWLTYETDEKGGGQRVCVEHIDRKDFLHPPGRKWSDLPWVARRAWMTHEQLEKRFKAKSQEAYERATLAPNMDNTDDSYSERSKKAGVWEVWHKADDKVYWVAEGVDVMLDMDEPHLKLRGFFPCPRPAYGTLKPRSLNPIPDYVRYAGHFKKINSLTKRIYDLLDMIRMKGLIPAGGDVGDAVEQALADDGNSALLIPVPSAALMSSSASGFVTWLPLAEIATAIQGLIEARRELFSDYDRLSGISDIMRGETDATETLGAQQLKSQYGSVRVREKVDELQRLARDVTQIAAEIMAEEFSKETLLDMSQMEIPTKAEIEKKIKEIESDAREELKDLMKKAQEAAQQATQQRPNPDKAVQLLDEAIALHEKHMNGSAPTMGKDGDASQMKMMQEMMAARDALSPSKMMHQQGQQQQDPQQMAQQGQQEFQKAQQQILGKYAPMLKEASEQVPIEDVMELLRDEKARGFAFEIETDSTVLTDEMQEKASRNEFLTTFSTASQGLMGLAAMGPSAAKLAGEIMKFSLQPYRVGRTLNSVIDEFIDSAPQMAAAAANNGAEEGNEALAAANMKLAEAEIGKAQAAIEAVKVKAAGEQQNMQLKMAEFQQSAKEKEDKLQLEIGGLQAKIKLTDAQIEKIYAEISKMGADVQSDGRTQDREDIKTVADITSRQTDQAMAQEDRQLQKAETGHSMQMAERQQGYAEQQGKRSESRADRQQEFSEESTDRQMTLAERQAMREKV